MIVLLFLVFLSLGFADHLKPINEFLDSDALSFKIGDMRFSVYMLIKDALIVVGLLWFARIVSDFSEKQIKTIRGIRASNKALIAKIIQIVVYFFCFLIGLDFLGVDLTAFALFGSAFGIGLGFGLQKITSNFISGIILLFEKSVENDDLVELNDGIFGIIRHIGARYTLVETLNGKEVMVPNEDFITSRVINWTYSNKKGRIDVQVGVSYDSDLEKVQQLIVESAMENELCIDNPKPVCYLREFGESSVNFLLFFWVADVTRGRYKTQSEVMMTIWKKFKENNIEIPYPQRDVRIKESAQVKDK
ncbi:MAG: mechanosensitive ion channel [Alphaproteobacteria bacterium]|nr:mechanosensitive ion channel [Alphaproteobacteria bacterium]